MKKYKVVNIIGSFGILLDEELEADNETEAREEIFNKIYNNISIFIGIELEEIGLCDNNLIVEEDNE